MPNGNIGNNAPLNEVQSSPAVVNGTVYVGALDGAPHEVLLVVDATTGQNALRQAELFRDVTAVSGIVLTKLDGTAKGGIVLAIGKETRHPREADRHRRGIGRPERLLRQGIPGGAFSRGAPET